MEEIKKENNKEKFRNFNKLLWDIYIAIVIILLIVFSVLVYKNFQYIKYSPCEACIKMGYSCTGKISNLDKNAEIAWQELIKEKQEKIEEFKNT